MAPPRPPRTPGPLGGDTRPAAGPGDRGERLAKDKARLTNLARATLRLGQFQDEVMARAESWQGAARDIGSAYATAAKRHTDALAKQDKIEALKTQLMFSVLTVATADALSWVNSGLALGDKYPN